ncbi:hypothetical protein KBC80_05520 [Candidatus Woesebacteria bacterium]|nr:hypothetical protein [Candidatus Paceibacterota bacterium]MBP9814614.1 hypothetical protein [Candidatus Woesebacteria bacterium]
MTQQFIKKALELISTRKSEYRGGGKTPLCLLNIMERILLHYGAQNDLGRIELNISSPVTGEEVFNWTLSSYDNWFDGCHALNEELFSPEVEKALQLRASREWKRDFYPEGLNRHKPSRNRRRFPKGTGRRVPSRGYKITHIGRLVANIEWKS